MFENWAGLFAIVERAIANGRFNRANHRKAKMNEILRGKFEQNSLDLHSESF